MAGGTDPTASAARIPVFRLPAGPAQTSPARSSTESDDDGLLPLLSQNAIWFCHLRWVVAGALTLAGLAALFPDLPAGLGISVHPIWPFAMAALVGALNLLFIRQLRRLQYPARNRNAVRRQLWVQIGADLVVLTVVLYGLGGGLVSARFMYLFHIILACIVFPAWESLAVVGLAAGLQLLMLAFKSMADWTPFAAAGLRFEPGLEPVRGVLPIQETVVMLLIWGVIWHLASELSRRLRRRDCELALTNRRLNASLEERTAHMLQTTHQLKAPFAAIHAHAQLLSGGLCGELTDSARATAEKISVRCVALSRQIQDMLQLANLRSKGQGAPSRETFDLAALADAAMDRAEPAARQRHIRLRKHLRPFTVHAVRDHLTMLLDNLIVNAVNYSHDCGTVSVFCGPGRGQTGILSVRDHGIGIPAEKLSRVFEDYFRTDQAVRHNRASTGLGLAIARQVARAADITLEVRSSPGWGSRFTAFLPGAPFSTQPSTTTTLDTHGLPADHR